MSKRKARAHERGVSFRTVLVGLTTALIIGVMAIGLIFGNRSVSPAAAQAAGPANIAVGDRAPAFSVSTTQGAFSLDAVKQPVLLEVFATWCPHCQHETKTINALYDTYKDRISIVAVSGSPYAGDRTSPASLEDVLQFAQYFKVRYPIAFDGSLGVANAYLQAGYPTIVLVDASKRIRYIGSGEIAKKVLIAAIDGVLKK